MFVSARASGDRDWAVSFPVEPSEAVATRERRWVDDYSGRYRSHVECVRPKHEAELAACLRDAARTGRRVTLRGGGQCLDGQSVGDDLVVDLGAFDAVHFDASTKTVTAQAGALWGSVFDALPPGWVLRNLVTTPRASVGGTLAGDAVSRFSSTYGREADGVLRVRVMAADGTVRTCTRGGDHAWLLAALAGSLGAVGVILSVEHEVVDASSLRRASPDGALRVRTIAHKHRDARGLVDALADELRAEPSALPRGVYGAARARRRRALLLLDAHDRAAPPSHAQPPSRGRAAAYH
jgi:FAD/FMN-containing dehydrogenase